MIRVSVTDGTRVPISDADLVLLKRKGELERLARTDASGRFAFRIDSTKFEYEIVVRKLGYSSERRAFTTHAGDTVLVEIALDRSANPLDTVRVVESELARDKRPYLGADEIAANKDFTMSLADVLVSIRSDIGYQAYRCLSPRDPGIMVRGPIPPPGGYRARLAQRLFDGMQVFINGEAVSRTLDPGHLIHKEHIAEVRYVNCFDRSNPTVPVLPWPALYVTLKPGVDWDIRRGSFVRDTVRQ